MGGLCRHRGLCFHHLLPVRVSRSSCAFSRGFILTVADATTPVDDAVAAFVPIPAPPGWPVRRPPTTSTTSPSPTTPTPTTNNRRRRSTHPSPRPMGTLEDNHNQGPGLNCRRPLMHTLTAATASINHRPVHRLLETGRRRRRARIKTASQTDRKNGRKDLYWTTVAFQRTVLWALEVDGDDDSPCVGPYCLVSRDINDDYVSTTIPVSALHTDDARSDDLNNALYN